MASLDDQLVLVGGRISKESTNQIAVYEHRSETWRTDPYPPMKYARNSSTAISFNNHIIVAGGEGSGCPCTSISVEVLDVEARRWYTAESLPNI